MTEDEQKQSFDDLGARLAKAQQANKDPNNDDSHVQTGPTGLGQAFRIGVDMLSALIVGTGMGWYLDHWLGTKPWFLIIFIFLGGAAGIMNVYRTGMRMVADVENENENARQIGAKEPDSAESDHKESEK